MKPLGSVANWRASETLSVKMPWNASLLHSKEKGDRKRQTDRQTDRHAEIDEHPAIQIEEERT